MALRELTLWLLATNGKSCIRMPRMTLCEIIVDGRVLLKLASRGVSKGKWNGLGGGIEPGETPEESVLREVREESGLRIKKPKFHGIIKFYAGPADKSPIITYIFSARQYGGRMHSSDEGKLKWFPVDSIPYKKMWNDDLFWWPLMLNGIRFDAKFVFDKKMERVVSYSINRIRGN